MSSGWQVLLDAGAACLASTSALRSGAGIVRLLHPKGMGQELVSSPYELLKEPYEEKNPEQVWELMNRAAATFIGPGIGVTDEEEATFAPLTAASSSAVCHRCRCLDDSCGVFSGGSGYPQDSVLTPHIGEMKRLLKVNDTTLSRDFLNMCRTFTDNRRCTLVLKGGPTFLFHPQLPDPC